MSDASFPVIPATLAPIQPPRDCPLCPRLVEVRQSVAARHAGSAQRVGAGCYLRAAVGDMHLAVDRQHMALPRHRRTDHEALERQPVHIDVEIGE